MPESPLPDVRNAPWLRPYRFSGVCPGRAWGLMLVAALVGGIVVGVIGYWGGWLTYWLSQFALSVTGGMWGSGLLGTGVSVAVILIVFLTAGVGYPALLGGMAGGVVVSAAERAQCRRIGVAVAFGLLAGLAAWGAVALTGLLVQGGVRESSRVLDNILGVPDWVSLAVIGLDALLLTGFGGYGAARMLGDTPYCETCGKWFGVSKKAELPLDHAALLVGALAGGSTASLSAAPADDAANRIELRFQRCECEGSDAVLTADAKWTQAARKGTQKKSGRWFATTVPAPLAHELEKALFEHERAETARLQYDLEHPIQEVPHKVLERAEKLRESDPQGALALLEEYPSTQRHQPSDGAKLSDLRAELYERCGRHDEADLERAQATRWREQQLEALERQIATWRHEDLWMGLIEKGNLLEHLGRRTEGARCRLLAADLELAKEGDVGARASLAGLALEREAAAGPPRLLGDLVAIAGMDGGAFTAGYQHGASMARAARAWRDELVQEGRAIALAQCERCGGIVEADDKHHRCAAGHHVTEVRVVVMEDAAAGWYSDPWRRFTHRWWDGETWTSHVARRGTPAEDPPGRG